MQSSIRVWIILALNGFVIGVAIVLGWIAQDAAGQVVEERFAKELVGGVSRFLASKEFPLSDSMMGYLREMHSAEWVTLDENSSVVASSLDAPATRDFEQRVRRSGPNGVMKLDGKEYRFDFHDVTRKDVSPGPATVSPAFRLYVLVPNAQFQEARNRATRRVAGVVFPAAAVATLLAIVLAFGISHPILRLTREMDRLAGSEEEVDAASPHTDGIGAKPAGDLKARHDWRHKLISRGPNETRQLAVSFYGLLDRLGAARHRLAQNERLAALGKISLSVAHELRNPLSGIKMNMRVLQDRMKPADDPGVEAIVREIDRMELYLNELMSLAPGASRPGAALSFAPLRLSSLADSVLTILSGRCRHARITVERDYPASEPLVSGDANEIRQAMMNFIVNAIEAIPGGGPVRVSVRPESSIVKFSVRDSGHGVQNAGADIFEAFASGKPNGVGLGLYLSKQIIDRHSGRIGYDNDITGAVFWFELPITRGGDQSEPAAPVETTSEPA